MSTFLKQVESSISTIREKSRKEGIYDENIVYTLGNRTKDDKTSNYFASFNLPYSYEILGSGTTISKHFPEKYQLNTDKAAFISISKNNFSETIDGRTITLTIPQTGGTNTNVKVVSAFFSETDITKKSNNDSYFGENIAFLFSDDINRPYSGTTGDGAQSRASITTWGWDLDFRNRPNAVAYQDLEQGDKDSDGRVYGDISYAVNVPEENWPEPLDQGYNYDIPVGIAFLDKGYMVITHPDIVESIPWTSGYEVAVEGRDDVSPGSSVIIGAAGSKTTNIIFSGDSDLNYSEINTTYSTSVVCLALPQEFFISTNPSWNRVTNLEEVENETYNLDDIWITQIGLYNINEELIAVSKLDRPLLKTYTNILTFNLNIDV